MLGKLTWKELLSQDACLEACHARQGLPEPRRPFLGPRLTCTPRSQNKNAQLELLRESRAELAPRSAYVFLTVKQSPILPTLVHDDAVALGAETKGGEQWLRVLPSGLL